MVLLLIEMSRSTAAAVEIAWWIGIVVALIVTVIDVHLLIRVINAARKINGLADRTLPAAVGIVGNTASIAKLGATLEVAAGLIKNAGPIVEVADAIDRKLGALSAHVGGGKR